MEQQWLDTFIQEVSNFSDAAARFDAGELSRKDYKGVSGGLGSYAQHDPSKHMLRLRMAGGRLTQSRLAFLAQAVEAYRIDTMKLTTCETVQLHNLSASQLPQLMLDAVKADIFVKGGGGDNPRNVMMSPLAGVQAGEAFDVSGYPDAVANYLLSICRDIKMPRKLKIAFCNGVDDRCHSAFRDMGFLAQPDGTFRLRIAGGLGASNPKMGVEVVEQLPANQVLYAVRAMVDTFCQHGCYENRAKARTRFMQDTLGAEGLKQAFLKNFNALLDKGGLDLAVAPREITKAGTGTLEHPRAIPQKQPGLYTVTYHPLGGLLPPEKPAQLLSLLEKVDCAECRIAPDETLYILNLTAQEAQKILEATEDGAVTDFERSVACIGAAICQQGVRDSQAVLRACVQAVRQAGIPAGALPKVAISGCPSSCAAPQAAKLGLMGAAKNGESAFRVLLGGSDNLGKANFGTFVGIVLERDLPAMFVDLGKAAGDSYDTFAENPEAVMAVIAKYL